ncbi:hypothetical protein [Christiangramia echinicola]|uniref:hypothetical protein n=1 Tax=Christiangramia echinicola TaxID=279359 RepID=UPI0004173B62|nr:hypothetical protein [Christiangramia echinicola]
MSTLVNLVISFFMGILFGHQIEEPRTAHLEFQKDSTEIYKKLEARQKLLNC